MSKLMVTEQCNLHFPYWFANEFFKALIPLFLGGLFNLSIYFGGYLERNG
jgi:hypothetical protein